MQISKQPKIIVDFSVSNDIYFDRIVSVNMCSHLFNSYFFKNE